MDVLNLSSDLTERIITAIAITGSGLIAFYAIFYFLRKWSRQKGFFSSLLEQQIHYPGLFLFLVITLNIDLERFKAYIEPELHGNIRHFLQLMLITASAFFIMRVINVMREITLRLYAREDRQDYVLRAARTKFQLIQRVINVIIIFTAVAAALMTFENIKEIGNTLLASAGIMGIVLGFAAQKSLGTLFAGIQIAISQPIKIGDIVIVENKYGTIAEITLTYVVLNMWDEKRLVVPINFFLEKTFENWTRVSSEILGVTKVYADYKIPLDDLRKQFIIWLNDSPLWDKRTSALQVTGATEKVIEIRTIMSARNSGEAFDLECYIRENMIKYIQANHPDSLPVLRLSINRDAVQEISPKT